VTIAATMVWLELSLSVPRFELSPGREVAVPRSGGEKNFVRPSMTMDGKSLTANSSSIYMAQRLQTSGRISW